MSVVGRRNWTAPDGTRYVASVVERMVTEGNHVRMLRRVEFATPEGQLVGDAAVPAYFSLDMASSVELEELWRWAVG